MSITIDKLLILQDIDTDIRNMKKELSDIPARKAQEETRLESHLASMEDAKENIKVRQAEVKQSELEIESKKTKIAKLRQQQLDIKTNKEFKAIESEVLTLEEGIAEIENAELVLMENVEEANKTFSEADKTLKDEKEAVQKDVAVFDERIVDIEKRLAEVSQKREQSLQDIDPKWLARYEALFARKDIAVVPLIEGVCGGCHMKLPPSVTQDVKKESIITSCDYCGRMLYSP